MMDNIEEVLGNFFRRVSSDKIIRDRISGDAFKEKEFVRLMRNYSDRYSDTEFENMYNYLSENFLLKYYGMDRIDDMNGGLDIFSLLKCYSSWILTFQGNEIVCEYNKMFHWRNVTKMLSEDLIVASFLADKDARNGVEVRYSFDWKPFITHNNEELRKIIKRGLSENHYHLKGSAPIFQLTWISLMNDITSKEFADNLHAMEADRRNANKKYEEDYTETKFLTQVEQAALIRLFLVSVLLDTWITIGSYPQTDTDEESREHFMEKREKQTEINVRRLLSDVNMLTAAAGEIQAQIMTLKYRNPEKGYPDYALNGIENEFTEDRKGMAYHGERWFIYEMLKGIYTKNKHLMQYQDLFYAYLVIKENIRAEIIQVNKYVGFENFRIYQDRKEFFLETSFLNNLLVKEAIQSSLLDSNVLSLEARIAPKNTAKEMRSQLQKLDAIICGDNQENRRRIFYTVHFIKTGKEKYSGEFPVMCRHYKLRKRVCRQAHALAELRERYPREGERIRAIDAANTEIGCGPEVFGQAFRFLRNHMSDGYGDNEALVPQLHITYHVGEDFLDMVSGLRAIDEAICFLNLDCGARLGHALVLGVDPSEWYHSKNERIFISQQEYLDNIVWMYHMLRSLRVEGTDALRDYLKRQFHYYFSIIYKEALDKEFLEYVQEKATEYYAESSWADMYRGNAYDFDIESYYCAWCLRGDDPYNYRNGFYENGYNEMDPGNKYDAYSVNREFPIKQEGRYFMESGVLYHLYHFSNKVRREGQKCIEIKVKPIWQQAIYHIQQGMQRKIAKYGIGIETNPSSNCEIGTFKRYDRHPIIRFYNRPLFEGAEGENDCEQMNVSINTDDQGVFNTSLENEYAYMALALEKKKNEKGEFLYKKRMIYQWIDDVRKMGIGQTFLSESEIGELKLKA